MTRAMLEQLHRARAFDPTPTRADLAVYHSPTAIDSSLLEAAAVGDRIALVGGSGTGKSSVLAGTLTKHPDRLTPVWVDVAADGPRTAVDPAAVARLAITSIVDTLEGVETVGEQALRNTTANRPVGRETRAGVGGKLLNVSTELQQQAQVARSAREVVEALHVLLIEVADHGTRPLLVFDDTDRWLAGTIPDAETIWPQFFDRTIRELGRRSKGLVVAVHHTYLDSEPTRRAIDNTLTATFEVPVLTDLAAVVDVLETRIAEHCNPATAGDVFTADALDALNHAYRTRCDLQVRRLMRIAHSALALAIDDHQADTITAPLVLATVD